MVSNLLTLGRAVHLIDMCTTGFVFVVLEGGFGVGHWGEFWWAVDPVFGFGIGGCVRVIGVGVRVHECFWFGTEGPKVTAR